MPMPTIHEEVIRKDDFNYGEKFPIKAGKQIESVVVLDYDKFIKQQLFFKPWN